ncbi:MAG: POT family MFS transporter [Planctomycetaceae bacterium]|nr:POT family MFS transporter [Planctomycetaceae bacterium]
MAKYQTTPPDMTHMPPGVPYIVGNEMAERFSFYGMKSILTIFMTKHLLDMTGSEAFMDDESAKEWVHYFTAAVYFFPIIGAFFSDWLTGKYPMIIWLSIVYCIGHFVLALMDVPAVVGMDPKTLLALGLILISIGGGGIKPCVSAHVGDQFGKSNSHLLEKVYGWFYFSINLGSTVSTLLTPWLLAHWGPGWAFGVPGALMVLATIVFWMGRNKFVHIPPSGDKFFSQTFSREGLQVILMLAPLYYIFVSMFWAQFDQTASAWVLQAEKMNRNVFGFELLSSQLQAANPILVMVLIPVFSYLVYPFMGKFFEVTPLRKIGFGLFITVLASAIPGWVQTRIDAGETPHIFWQVFAYLVLTSAEVMVSITVLEFSYTQAPKSMKSIIMGLQLLSVTVGNLFVAQINKMIRLKKEAGESFLQGADYYWFFSGCMLAAAILFVVWSQFYRGKTYIQGDDEGETPTGADEGRKA